MYYMKGEKTIKEWRSKETAEVTESKRETEVIGQILYPFPRRRFKKEFKKKKRRRREVVN